MCRCLYIFAVLAVGSQTGCQADIYTTDIKEYRFTIEPRTERNVQLFRSFFRTFNRQFEKEFGQPRLLQLTSTKTNNTSTIHIGDDSQYRIRHIDGQDYKAVGRGNWQRNSYVHIYGGILLRQQKVIENVYSMRLYFNDHYLHEWHNSTDYLTRQRAYTLFLHELGHGMQMRHESESTDIMYYRINRCDKDIPAFMQRVAAFMMHRTVGETK